MKLAVGNLAVGNEVVSGSEFRVSSNSLGIPARLNDVSRSGRRINLRFWNLVPRFRDEIWKLLFINALKG